MNFELNKVYNIDCMEGMSCMPDNVVDFTITDIPYNFWGNMKTSQDRAIYRGGVRQLNKGCADIITFNLNEFLSELLRITKGSICVFCGFEQFSQIYSFFSALENGTVRPLIWVKKNPSPMNGKYIYLSSAEFAVWYRPPGAAFNVFCKRNVFEYSQGSSELFPTQKNMALWEDIITDNAVEGNNIFDPCMGSGTTALAALKNKMNFLGFEIDQGAFNLIQHRLSENILYWLHNSN